MTSQINYSGIDGTYPIAGQDNNSQGFRDNFTLIKTNFQEAYNEITALQTNSVQVGQTINLGANTVVGNGVFNSTRVGIYDFGSVSGPQTINFNNGSYQKITMTGSTSIGGITNWPAGVHARIRIEIIVNNTGWTFTWPSVVSLNMTSLANYVSGTPGATSITIGFTQIGTYIFELSSSNGVTFSVQDLDRNRNVVQGNLSLQTVVANASVTAINMTASNVAGVAVGNITATNFIGNISATGIQYGIQYVAASDGGSTTIDNNVSAAIFDPSGTISSYTINMPSSPKDGQGIKIMFGNTITSITHSASQTLKGALTTGSAAAGGEYVYHSASDSWYRSN